MQRVRVIPEVFSQDQVERLKHWYYNDTSVFHDVRPGISTKDLNPNTDLDHWPGNIINEKMHELLGSDAVFDRISFMETNTKAHVHVHVDAGHDAIVDLEKKHNIIFPLEHSGEETTTFFDNYWLGQSVKFTRQSLSRYSYFLEDIHGVTHLVKDLTELLEAVETGQDYQGLKWPEDEAFKKQIRDLIKQRSSPYNRPIISDYRDVINVTDQPFDRVHWQRWVHHIDYNDLHGLKLDQPVQWQVGSAVVFNKTQLHCSGPVYGKKLHIIIFTR